MKTYLLDELRSGHENGVDRDIGVTLPKQDVVGSNPITRSTKMSASETQPSMYESIKS